MSKAEHPLAYEVKEKQLQATIIGLAREHGWAIYHPYDSRKSVPGYPDLTLVHPVHGVVWLELKVQDTRKGRLSEHQVAWLDLLRTAGQRAWVIRPLDMGFVEQVLRGEAVDIEEVAA